MTSQHWAFRIAEQVINQHKGRQITCATGISPSGIVHAGNLREALTSDFVYRAILSKGANARLIFSWDDFDRLRKIPLDVPGAFKEHIGKPYCDIPDPFGEFKTYAQRYETLFEREAQQLGINARFIRQNEMYRSGAYDEQIRHVLQRRKQIAQIIARNMTQGMTNEQIEAYFPVAVYSRFTGKDTTKIISFDGERKIEYICLDTNKQDTIDFTVERNVKLPWKIDWPMRWKFEGADFEPGGTDHASPQGSYDVGSQISCEVFDNNPPFFLRYQFVRIKGMDAKMSSSKGNVFSPSDLLSIYPPELVRWLYCRASPDSLIDLAFDTDVIRAYDEFDRRLDSQDTLAKQELTLSLPTSESKLPSKPLSFRNISGMGDATDFNLCKITELLSMGGREIDTKTLEQRLLKSRRWMEKYCPEARSRLIMQPNNDYYSSLPQHRQEQLKRFAQTVQNAEHMTLEQLENELYSIPKRSDMAEQEKKIAQREFFKDVYILLFGKEQGPRLPTFIWAADKEQCRKLLDFAHETK